MGDNHDEFGRAAGVYLLKLHRSFPELDYITPKDLGIDVDSWGADADRAAAAAHWLLDNKFVKGERHAAGVMLVTLTPKAQRLMDSEDGYGRTWAEAIAFDDVGSASHFRKALLASA